MKMFETLSARTMEALTSPLGMMVLVLAMLGIIATLAWAYWDRGGRAGKDIVKDLSHKTVAPPPLNFGLTRPENRNSLSVSGSGMIQNLLIAIVVIVGLIIAAQFLWDGGAGKAADDHAEQQAKKEQDKQDAEESSANTVQVNNDKTGPSFDADKARCYVEFPTDARRENDEDTEDKIAEADDSGKDETLAKLKSLADSLGRENAAARSYSVYCENSGDPEFTVDLLEIREGEDKKGLPGLSWMADSRKILGTFKIEPAITAADRGEAGEKMQRAISDALNHFNAGIITLKRESHSIVTPHNEEILKPSNVAKKYDVILAIGMAGYEIDENEAKRLSDGRAFTLARFVQEELRNEDGDTNCDLKDTYVYALSLGKHDTNRFTFDGNPFIAVENFRVRFVEATRKGDPESRFYHPPQPVLVGFKVNSFKPQRGASPEDEMKRKKAVYRDLIDSFLRQDYLSEHIKFDFPEFDEGMRETLFVEPVCY